MNSLISADPNTTTFLGLFRLLKSDMNAYIPNSNWIKSLLVSRFEPGLRLLFLYRLGRFFFLRNNRTFYLHSYLRYRMYKFGGNEISFSASIGLAIRFAHPSGVIIGANCIVGDNVKIFQQVTLGSHGKGDRNKGYPILENGVCVYSGAKIIGDVYIGENSIIGANSVVNKNVPANSIAAGIPFRILAR